MQLSVRRAHILLPLQILHIGILFLLSILFGTLIMALSIPGINISIGSDSFIVHKKINKFEVSILIVEALHDVMLDR